MSIDSKWGFVDSNGEEIIPLKYDSVTLFYNGISEVELNGKKFYINTKGEQTPYN